MLTNVTQYRLGSYCYHNSRLNQPFLTFLSHIAPMADFKYTPIDLESSAFRLVRLLAADASSAIQCELMEAWYTEGDGGMPYEALSYTWGGREKNVKISVNEREMCITQNLYDAMQHLRFPDQDRILWIDAICIDQENDKE